MHASAVSVATSEVTPQFLDGLSPLECKAVLGAASALRFHANSVITNQHQPADRLFMLKSGLTRYFVITEEGRKLLFRWLGPGDLFGGRTVLLNPSTYLCSTEAVVESSVLVWDRRTIRRLVTRYPRLLENVLLTASDYVEWHLKAGVGLACHTARQRVASVLVTLARTIGQRTPRGISLPITNEDLANAANVSRFTASRLISEWQRNRILEKRRGDVLLLSPERLSLV